MQERVAFRMKQECSGGGRTGRTSLDFSGLWRDFADGLKTAQERGKPADGFREPSANL